jgi:hypothetical protein
MLEELRFAKKQQWSIATSAVTLIAAIFEIAHVIEEPKPGEKVVEKIVAGRLTRESKCAS